MNASRQYLSAIVFAVLAVICASFAARLSLISVKIRSEAPRWLLSYSRPSLRAGSSFLGRDDNAVNFSGARSPGAQSQEISAKAYVVANVANGSVYFGHNADAPLPVASMSKLVTAIAATDTFPATTTIVIDADASSTPPDNSRLVPGERFELKDLLYAMLLDSSNVAANAIASTSDRGKFMSAMTAYAWEIGMPSTFFADPSGIDPRNAASASDILVLARYLYEYRPDILALTRVLHMSVATTTDHGAHDFDSTHPFVSDPRFIGGKTGRTPQAGETMLTILRIDDQPVAFIVLGSAIGSREWDTKVLIDRYMHM